MNCTKGVVALDVVLCSILSLKYFQKFSFLFFPRERVCSFRTDDFITSVKTVGVKRKQEFDVTWRVTWGIVPCTLPCNKVPFSFFTLSLAERSMESHECKIREISHCDWLLNTLKLYTSMNTTLKVMIFLVFPPVYICNNIVLFIGNGRFWTSSFFRCFCSPR